MRSLTEARLLQGERWTDDDYDAQRLDRISLFDDARVHLDGSQRRSGPVGGLPASEKWGGGIRYREGERVEEEGWKHRWDRERKMAEKLGR